MNIFFHLSAVCLPLAAQAAAVSDATVFEAERVIADSHMLASSPRKDRWAVAQSQIHSGGAVIRGPVVLTDMPPDQCPYPTLKFKIPVSADGKYQLFAKTHRCIGFSVDDGKNWIRGENVTRLGKTWTRRKDECIEILVKGCFSVKKSGPVYLDTFTLIRCGDNAIRNPDFRDDQPGQRPAVWQADIGDPRKNSLKVEDSPSGKVLHLQFRQTSKWELRNPGVLPCEPGDAVRLSFRVKNHMNRIALIQPALYRLDNGKKIRLSGLDVRVEPGTEIQAELLDIVPDDVMFQMRAYREADLQFSDFRLENLGPADRLPPLRKWRSSQAKVEKNNGTVSISCSTPWQAESPIRLVGSGRPLRVSFPLTRETRETGVRAFIRGYYGSSSKIQRYREFDLPTIPHACSVTAELAFVLPAEVNAFSLLLQGRGRVSVGPVTVSPATAKAVRHSNFQRLTDGFAMRSEEKIGRGFFAGKREDGLIYLGWRLLKSDPADIAFDVFACLPDGREIKLNRAPILRTTDFTTAPSDPAARRYAVRPVHGGVTDTAIVTDCEPGVNPYKEYVLPRSNMVPRRVLPADLDGDGRFDYICRTGNQLIDPWNAAWEPSREAYTLEAFRHDGKHLWSYSMGPNIEAGIWYAPWSVYDLDGDGKAEVIVKGTLPEDGSWAEPDGYERGKVQSGPERLLVLDGLTGKILAHAPWPERTAFMTGIEGYNHASRNQLAIAYLDGKTPCILVLRGTYGLMIVDAWRFQNRQLTPVWHYTSADFPAVWRGQGAHVTRIADVDGDGRDEIILGSAVLDDDGKPLWTTGLGHPDFVFVGNLSHKHPGLEVAEILESSTRNGGGITMSDAKTGRALWRLDKPASHLHYGFCGDLDARLRGWEIGATDGGHGGKGESYFFSADGELLFSGKTDKVPYRKQGSAKFLYWDADLQREQISRFRFLDYRGGAVDGYTPGVMLMSFDVEGDWREELCTSNGNAFRIYVSTIPAMDRRVTLMQDPIYRLGIAASGGGYLNDRTHTELLTDTAINLNLTALAAAPGTAEIVVSAPLGQNVAGKLYLTADGGVTPVPAEFDVQLAPGGRFVAQTVLKGMGRAPVRLRGELRLADGSTRRVEVPAGKTAEHRSRIQLPPGLVVEAENFVAEQGGTARIRQDKIGISGSIVSHWDRPGHAISWNVAAPEEGQYTLFVAHAWFVASSRTLAVNGREFGVFELPSTAGGGESAAEWKLTQAVDKNGSPLIFPLNKGNNTVKLNNDSGCPMNIDYLLFRKEK